MTTAWFAPKSLTTGQPDDYTLAQLEDTQQRLIDAAGTAETTLRDYNGELSDEMVEALTSWMGAARVAADWLENAIDARRDLENLL